MAEYNFNDIEKKWQTYWKQNATFKTSTSTDKPKFYSLDMFPYPSGAGLHVGHPLGYIASDIVSRYKRNKGFNVLHPMGFDAFGLPAEQYAIQTGQHPAITTENNISTYKKQLDNLGFSFDWDREIRTCEAEYYKWTQWIFIQLFNSWYNNESNKAENISTLVAVFEQKGSAGANAHTDYEGSFTASEWNAYSEEEKQALLLNYRLAFLAETSVNWCPALGTVLANEEVKDGVSERGGYPVEKKKMQQWSLRITAYADRLLNDLEALDWSDSVKEMQRNWIGKSVGSTLRFQLEKFDDIIEVFTTRPDTVFGVTFVTLAPEHPLVAKITTDEQKEAVDKYVLWAKNRSERDRISDTEKTGEFTGAYVINPFTKTLVPVWTSDYVLAGYGTGAVMAVPSSDVRDFEFATKFNLPIIQVYEGEFSDISKENFEAKTGKVINSEFLNGLETKEAIHLAIQKIEELGVGKGKVNFRIRDAIFSRQRYWGEPIPVYYKNNLPYVIEESELPLTLPEIDAYQPTETGEPPLGRAKDWLYQNKYGYELSTMPGWAGSSWYFLRYMDSKNDGSFVSKEAQNYWQEVDLYIGGAEHATGHLLYSRFWNKFLFDLGLVSNIEPFKKLVNQGMIQGVSEIIYLITDYTEIDGVAPLSIIKQYFNFEENGNVRLVFLEKEFVTKNKLEKHTSTIHIPIEFVDSVSHNLNLKEYINSEIGKTNIQGGYLFLNENGYLFKGKFSDESFTFYCSPLVEKMSKSKYNVVNPDNIVAKYGADTLRMYEMFLGPLEQFKPWNTNSIDGVARFLRRVWRLFYNDNNEFIVSEEAPSKEELKHLHKTIKKVEEDIERLSFNTSVSTFMVLVNELTNLKCSKRAILEPFLVILSPYAPHITEELWSKLGHTESISKAVFPAFNEEYLVESDFEYPVSINGKVRHKLNLPLSLSQEEIQKEALSTEQVTKWMEGKTPKKVIIVPGKIINIVI
ncbi:MAG: hypothetical protein RLZZ175_241 [Bacteroidota bacterium]|jgi:leucyl-tRNA synthetase